jgi:NADH:ubiquinone oxidoreductase subunit 2 (subunit N)
MKPIHFAIAGSAIVFVLAMLQCFAFEPFLKWWVDYYRDAPWGLMGFLVLAWASAGLALLITLLVMSTKKHVFNPRTVGVWIATCISVVFGLFCAFHTLAMAYAVV